MTQLQYRTIYARVPRAVLEQYWHEPWDVVIDAARAGKDGLSVHHGRPQHWHRPAQRDDDAPDNVAFLTNGQGGEWEHETVLHQQNW